MIATFRDWWSQKSEEIFAQAEKDGNWLEAFEKCWDASQMAELQRCAQLDAERLAMEARRDRAGQNGYIKEWIDLEEKLDKLVHFDD